MSGKIAVKDSNIFIELGQAVFWMIKFCAKT